MKIFVTPKVLSQDGFPNTFGFTLSLTWAYLGVLETKQSVSFCTYVRLAVKITQLLKDKLCANIPGRINILIPLFFFFFPFVVWFSPSWTTLSRNALPSSFLVPDLHKHISSIPPTPAQHWQTNSITQGAGWAQILTPPGRGEMWSPEGNHTAYQLPFYKWNANTSKGSLQATVPWSGCWHRACPVRACCVTNSDFRPVITTQWRRILHNIISELL